MKKFVILTDTSSDLKKELRDKYNIEYVCMRYIYGNVDVPASLDWEHKSPKEFYDIMRQGTRITTSQVPIPEYVDAFEKFAEEGYDILYLACSSALSASYKGSLVARDEVLAKYPETKIICVDALRASMGLGLMCITAAELRDAGKTIEEVANYVEETKLNVHQVGTVEDLIYLKRAGRVSTMSAVFGGLLKIKPIIIADALGQNAAVEKVKGRNASLRKIVEMIKATYLPHDHQKLAILHADCKEDADKLQEMILAAIPDKDVEVITNYIGPAIGASVGPGMLAVYYYGTKVNA